MLHKKRCRRLHLEALEDRFVPATAALWPDSSHLTLSFVPDGTQVAAGTSDFFADLAPGSSAAAIEQTILRAFQTWAQYANVNISVTGDNGAPLGTAGLVQGDPRFGDIRIAAEPLSPSTVATGTPYLVSGSTWSGDLVFNSNYQFGSGAGQYDLYTVALHEAGHVFGLPDETTDPTSVEYQTYEGPRQGLSAGDIQAIQSAYGVRTGDAFQANGGNHTPATATNLNAAGTTSVPTLLMVNGDVTTNQDVEYYRFTTDPAAHPNGVTVQLRTSLQSFLTGQVTVYDSLGNVVAAAATTDPLSGDLTIHLTNVAPGATYYVGVQGSQANPFGIGAYQLVVNLQPSAASVGAPSAFSTAQPLVKLGSNQQGTAGLISVANNTNVFSFKTNAGPYPNGLSVTLQTWGSGLGDPTLAVFDSAGNPLGSAYSVLPDGTFNLHLAKAAANSTFYVVATTPTLNSSSRGSYALQVDLNAAAGTQPALSSVLTNLVTGLLTNLVSTVESLLGLWWLTATNLTTVPGYAPQSKYQTVGGLNSSSAPQYYRLQSAPAASGQTDIMTISVLAQDATALSPQITVYDSYFRPVAATVLSSANGAMVIQVANAQPNAVYYVQVGAAQRPNQSGTGAFFLDTSFGIPASSANQAFASNTLTSRAAQDFQTLTVNQNALFSFNLSASTIGWNAAVEVQMFIFDANGNLVYQQISYAGQPPTTGTTYLQSGTYTVQFVAVPKVAGQQPALYYNLVGQVLSWPQGPQPVTPTGPNSSPPNGGSGSGYNWTGTGSSTKGAYYPSSSSYTYS